MCDAGERTEAQVAHLRLPRSVTLLIDLILLSATLLHTYMPSVEGERSKTMYTKSPALSMGKSLLTILRSLVLKNSTSPHVATGAAQTSVTVFWWVFVERCTQIVPLPLAGHSWNAVCVWKVKSSRRQPNATLSGIFIVMICERFIAQRVVYKSND